MSSFQALMAELWPTKTTFTADSVPDLKGKIIIVTGGNCGIGKETARVLIAHGARVYIACRSREKAEAAREELKSLEGKTDDDIRIIDLDLSDLASVKKGVDDFLRQESRLDVLYNSAGVMFPPLSQLTTHGHDLQFGTNALGHFCLTQLLLPTLLSSVATSSDGHVRVVNVASYMHMHAPGVSEGGPIVYESLAEGERRIKLGNMKLYGQSKAANIMFSNALARKYASQGVISIAIHPGAIKTELARHYPIVHWIIGKTILYPVELGAISSLYAGTSPEALELNGKYLVPWAHEFTHREDLGSVEKQEELWTWMGGEVLKYAPPA